MTESPIYIDWLVCGVLDTAAPRAAAPGGREIGLAGLRRPGSAVPGAPAPAPEPEPGPGPKPGSAAALAAEPALAPTPAAEPAPEPRGLGCMLEAALGLARPAPHTFRGRTARGTFALVPFAASGAWTLHVASDDAGVAIFALARAAPEKAGSVVRLTAAPGSAGASWEAAWPAGGAPLLRLRGAAQAPKDASFEAVVTGCGPPAS